MQINLELYHVLKDLNVPEDKAAKASSIEDDKGIRSDINLLKWMVGTNITLTFIILGKILFM